LEFLVNNKANVNLKAELFDEAMLHRLLFNSSATIGMVDFLVQQKADPNLNGMNDLPPLNMACLFKKDHKFLEYFIDKKSDVNYQFGGMKDSALHSLFNSKNHLTLEKVKVLIDNKADVHLKNANNQTPLDKLNSITGHSDIKLYIRQHFQLNEDNIENPEDSPEIIGDSSFVADQN